MRGYHPYLSYSSFLVRRSFSEGGSEGGSGSGRGGGSGGGPPRQIPPPEPALSKVEGRGRLGGGYRFRD